MGGVKNGLLNNLVERGQFRVVKDCVESIHRMILVVSECVWVFMCTGGSLGSSEQVDKSAKVVSDGPLKYCIYRNTHQMHQVIFFHLGDIYSFESNRDTQGNQTDTPRHQPIHTSSLFLIPWNLMELLMRSSTSAIALYSPTFTSWPSVKETHTHTYVDIKHCTQHFRTHYSSVPMKMSNQYCVLYVTLKTSLN